MAQRGRPKFVVAGGDTEFEPLRGKRHRFHYNHFTTPGTPTEVVPGHETGHENDQCGQYNCDDQGPETAGQESFRTGVSHRVPPLGKPWSGQTGPSSASAMSNRYLGVCGPARSASTAVAIPPLHLCRHPALTPRSFYPPEFRPLRGHRRIALRWCGRLCAPRCAGSVCSRLRA